MLLIYTRALSHRVTVSLDLPQTEVCLFCPSHSTNSTPATVIVTATTTTQPQPQPTQNMHPSQPYAQKYVTVIL